MCQAFEQRHDYLVGELNKLEGVDSLICDGTFYCFPNFQGLINNIGNITDDIGFAEYLLNETGIAAVPGTAFGSPGHIRLSYATGMDVLEEAVTRLKSI